MDRTELAFAGPTRHAELLRGKEISPTELVQLYLDRIDSLDPQLNSYRVTMSERALSEAAEAERRLAAGDDAPLLGIPIAVKDNQDVTGELSAHGTGAFDQPATADVELVRRLREAGAIVIGKTNLPELAICGFTESKTWGKTRNPWNLDHTPGGSSGGSAAAVAAGLASAATASDGAGSIRIPAACCGVFGLKPAWNRVPISPDRDHWYGLSVTGFITRSVVDTAMLVDVAIAGGPSETPAPKPLERTLVEAAQVPPGRLRIALSTKPTRAVAPPKATDDVKLAVSEAGELLRSLGHEVSERDPSFGTLGNRFVPRYLGGIRADVKAVPHPDRLESRTRGFGRLGAPFTAGQIDRAVRGAAKDWARVSQSLDGIDVLVTPVMGSLPVEVGRWEGKGALRTLLGMSVWYPFAGVWNHLDRPAASVPMGRDQASGLPRAVMLVGINSQEDTLISLAAQLEAERPWADSKPPLG